MPHSLKELFKQQEWYGRTSIVFANKRLKGFKILQFLLGPIMPSIPLIAMLLNALLLLFKLIPEFIGVLTLAVIVTFFLYRRVRFALKIPHKYRDFKTVLAVHFIDCILKPLAWSYGLMKALMSSTLGKQIEASRG